MTGTKDSAKETYEAEKDVVLKSREEEHPEELEDEEEDADDVRDAEHDEDDNEVELIAVVPVDRANKEHVAATAAAAKGGDKKGAKDVGKVGAKSDPEPKARDATSEEDEDEDDYEAEAGDQAHGKKLEAGVKAADNDNGKNTGKGATKDDAEAARSDGIINKATKRKPSPAPAKTASQQPEPSKKQKTTQHASSPSSNKHGGGGGGPSASRPDKTGAAAAGKMEGKREPLPQKGQMV